MVLVEKFAALLQITEPDETKRNKRIQTRLVGIGLGTVCVRCGGTGHHSFNPMNGTTCFGCGGSGYVAGRLSKDLLEKAEAAVTAGKLDEYLDDLRNRQIVKRAKDIVLKAWEGSGITAMYDWRKGCEEDTRLAGLNGIMYDEYQAVSKLVEEYARVSWQIKNRKLEDDADAKHRRSELEGIIPARVESAVAKIKETATRI